MANKRESKAQDRDWRHGMRGESASRCIGDIYPGCEIVGLTKGDFSMIDIIRHLVRQVGSCHVDVGTWTAAHADVTKAEGLLGESGIRSLRMLVDRSFPQRQPGYFEKVMRTFGRDAVRMARFHAKFALIQGGEWNIVLRTSMNLNENKRIELYEISDDATMMGYFKDIVDHHFAKPMEDSYSAFKDLDLQGDRKDVKINEHPKLGGWD